MSSNSSTVVVENVNRVGLGYGIAIAVGILVFVSTVMLATYVCVRVQRRNYHNSVAIQQHFNAAIVPQVTLMDDQSSGEWIVGGLDQIIINSYPKMVFCKENFSGDTVCSICLCEYKEEEMLRLMPECRHCFHSSCIDAWLRLHASCPICRTSPLPTPVSTPLSEIVPLAGNPLIAR